MKNNELNKRERQILDVIYQLGEASVQEVVDKIDDAPSYNAIRVTMYLLENKGYITHRKEGVRHIFKGKEEKKEAGSNALDHILRTFFEGSVPSLVTSLLGSQSENLSDKELDALSELIEKKKAQSKPQDDA